MASGEIAALLSALKDIYASRLVTTVGFTLAIYDWALVFPDEFETILQAKWTVPKALYYYIRCVTPLGILLCTYQLSNLRGPLTDYFCKIWAILQVLGMLSSLLAANGLLTLRLIALYRRKRAVVWFIRCFFVASYSVTIAIAIQGLFSYCQVLFYSTILGVCAALQPSKTFPAIFYAPAFFEAFVFALTAYRGFQDAKMIAGTETAPFLKVFYRDGFICFFVMIALRMWNIWIYLTQPLSSFNLGTQLMWAVNTILTTRVYMNLVWLARRPLIETTNVGSRVPVGPSIRMRVHTFTEIQVDDWKSKHPDTVLDTIDDTLYPRRL